MNIQYQRNLKNSYMVVVEEGQSLNLDGELAEKMMQKQDIPGLLQWVTMESGNDMTFWYQITGLQSLADWLSRHTLDYELFGHLLSGLLALQEELPRYYMKLEHILLREDQIFLDQSGRKVSFCYEPLWSREPRESLGGLMEQLLSKIDHGDKLAVRLGYGLYEKCQEANADIWHYVMEYAHGAQIEPEDETPERGWESEQAELSGDEGRGGRSLSEDMPPDTDAERRSRAEWHRAHDAEYRAHAERNRARDAEYRAGNNPYAARHHENGMPGAGASEYAAHINEQIDMLRQPDEAPRKKHFGGRQREREDALVREDASYAAQETRKVDTSDSGASSSSPLSWLQGVKAAITMPKKKPQAPPPPVYVFEPETEAPRTENPTVYLGADAEPEGRLAYEGTGSEADYIIDKDIFLIGGRNTDADARLKASGISRSHARITRDDGEYFIEDLNSRNGTYLNGQLLPYKERRRMKPGDRLRFAREEFLFY